MKVILLKWNECTEGCGFLAKIGVLILTVAVSYGLVMSVVYTAFGLF